MLMEHAAYDTQGVGQAETDGLILEERHQVAVLGGGGWGTALAKLLASNGHDVLLWVYEPEVVKAINEEHVNPLYLKGVCLPDNLRASNDIADVLRGRDLVVNAGVSQHLRSVMRQAKPHLGSAAVVISATKGIEPETYLRMTEVVAQELGIGPERIAALSGPNHAEEVSRGVPSTTVVAATRRELAERFQDLFMSRSFRVYTNPDVVGVELCGALKNIIALGAGICDGLGFGDNTKAALMTRGLTEMARLGVAMGADASTFAGLAGVGDLIATCTSQHSRNRWCGNELGKGRRLDEILASTKMVVEGVRTTVAAHALGRKLGVSLPITDAIYGVLYEDKSARESTQALMGRLKTHEIEDLAISRWFSDETPDARHQR
ncbi:MAG: NAD(P)H-dependent glycerol-3-phosphate dehydrogenase [Bacillota bacterium]